MLDHHEVVPVIRFRPVHRQRPRRDDHQRHHRRNPRQQVKLFPAPFPDQESGHRQPRHHPCDEPLGHEGQPGEQTAQCQQQHPSPGETRLQHRQKRRDQNTGDQAGGLTVQHGKGADAVDQPGGQEQHRRERRELVVPQRLVHQEKDQERRQPCAERTRQPQRKRVLSEDFKRTRRHPVAEHRFLEVAHRQQMGSRIGAGIHHFARDFRVTELIRRHQRPSAQRHQVGDHEKQERQPEILHQRFSLSES